MLRDVEMSAGSLDLLQNLIWQSIQRELERHLVAEVRATIEPNHHLIHPVFFK